MSNEDNTNLIQENDSQTVKNRVKSYVISNYGENRVIAGNVRDIYDITEYPKSFKQAKFDIYLACRFKNIFERLFETANNDKSKFEALLKDFKSIAYLKILYPSLNEGCLTDAQETKLNEISDNLAQIDDAAVRAINFEENAYLQFRSVKEAVTDIVGFSISTVDIGKTVTSDPDVVKDAQKVGVGIDGTAQENDRLDKIEQANN